MNHFEQIKRWIREITEISLLLVGLAVVIEILFGDTMPVFGAVVGNLVTLLGSLGEEGLIGVIAVGFILFVLFRKKTSQ